jgi:hypothetical protein
LTKRHLVSVGSIETVSPHWEFLEALRGEKPEYDGAGAEPRGAAEAA